MKKLNTIEEYIFGYLLAVGLINTGIGALLIIAVYTKDTSSHHYYPYLILGSIIAGIGITKFLLSIAFYKNPKSLPITLTAFIIVLLETLALASAGAKPYYPYLQFFNIGFVIAALIHIAYLIYTKSRKTTILINF